MPKIKLKVVKAPKVADLLSEYYKSLDERNRQAYEIAKDHLGMSFQLEKSLGFLDWLNKEEKK